MRLRLLGLAALFTGTAGEAWLQKRVNAHEEAPGAAAAPPAVCPSGSPGAAAEEAVQRSWEEFCGEQSCGDWDYSSPECWGLNAERCGWSCGSEDAPMPTTASAPSGIPIALRERARYGRAKLLDVENMGSALRVRVEGSGAFVWKDNTSFDLSSIQLHASPLALETVGKLWRASLAKEYAVADSDDNTTCSDSPVDWKDAEGDSCATYAKESWCLPDGSPGPGWDQQWGNFSRFARDGVTASDACCVCGGGDAPPGASSTTTRDPSVCIDDPEGWVDSDGDGCSVYVENTWCTPDGRAGPNFGGTAADFEHFANNGRTALTACCLCGGGLGGARPTTTTTTVTTTTVATTAAPTTTTAADGCVDDPEEWVDSDGDSCANYVLNEWCLPNGTAGPWFGGDFDRFSNLGRTALTACCACGGGARDNATASRPATSTTAVASTTAAPTTAAGTTTASNMSGCVDDPEGWVDSDGDGCEVYATNRWCTADGGAGPNFGGGVDDFARFGNDGHTALTACCACGGGRGVASPSTTRATSTGGPTTTSASSQCVDRPVGWVDSDGDSCATYEESQWCLPDGTAGQWFGGDFDRFANNGETALTACCACGGGERGGDTPPATTTSAAACVDDPEGWEDSDGDSCSTYERSDWCTPDGRPGSNFGGTIEDFDHFQNQGRTALTACCACGGGSRGGVTAPPWTAAPTSTPVLTTTATATSPASGCTDEPAGWRDSDGDSCDKYEMSGWCTRDGQPGPNFGGGVDDFSRFQNDGHTALTACCACGGGAQAAPATTARPPAPPASGCADDPTGWVDSDGDSCSRYEENQWCTRDGQPGPNFGGTVEDFGRYANDGHTALTACCACGGGSDGVATTPPPGRCTDRPRGWVDRDGDNCTMYALGQWCTPTGQPGPNFEGSADDFAAYGRDGYTALTACCACGGGEQEETTPPPPTSPPSTCVDDPHGWVDSDGDSCERYVSNNWCTPDGQPGSGFGGTIDDFSRFANNGSTALTACCACGGGSRDGQTHTTTSTEAPVDSDPVCADDPAGWVDSDGDSCSSYQRNDWCTPDGQPGSNFGGGLADFARFENNGHTALTACCACGGGSRDSDDGNFSAPTTTRPEETCADDPTGWTDSDGDDCAKYEGNKWCTPDGQPGPNFGGTVEDFGRFEHDGHTALTACCACGGGARGGSTVTATPRTTLPPRTTPPPTTDAPTCEDDPQGWVDSDGDNCNTYEVNGWCLPDGSAGPSFGGTVADFDQFANDGHTALTACCGCGGGARGASTRPPRPTTAAPASSTSAAGGSTECTDDPEGWADSDGDTCATYAENQWCTPEGTPGPSWAGTVADYQQYANDGHTALTACCACGGGTDGPATGSTSRPASTTTEAPLDSDPECVDDPVGWADSDGDTCAVYVDSQWCTPEGEPGPDFIGTAEDFSRFENDGRTALTACCGCGGGARPTPANQTTSTTRTTTRRTTTVPAGTSCKDEPSDWSDKDQDTCDQYAENNWCTPEGEVGDGWNREWGSPRDFGADGVSAFDVCCACGGGRTSVGGATTTTTTRTAPAGGCRGDKPEGWTDALGDGCEAYAANTWCTPEGEVGSGWQSSWGPLDEFGRDGVSALDACCVCGGGNRGSQASKKSLASSPQSSPGAWAELHLIHTSRLNGEQLVLVLYIRSGGPDLELLRKLGLEGEAAPQAHTTNHLGAEVDLADLAAAVGGLESARYRGSDVVPPCTGAAPTMHRLVAEKQLLASSAQLTALGCSLSVSPRKAGRFGDGTPPALTSTLRKKIVRPTAPGQKVLPPGRSSSKSAPRVARKTPQALRKGRPQHKKRIQAPHGVHKLHRKGPPAGGRLKVALRPKMVRRGAKIYAHVAPRRSVKLLPTQEGHKKAALRPKKPRRKVAARRKVPAVAAPAQPPLPPAPRPASRAFLGRA